MAKPKPIKLILPDPPDQDFWLYSPEVESELSYLSKQLDLGAHLHDFVKASLGKIVELGYPQSKADFIATQFSKPPHERESPERSPQITLYISNLKIAMKDTISTQLDIGDIGTETNHIVDKLLKDALEKHPITNLTKLKNSLAISLRKVLNSLLDMKDEFGPEMLKLSMAPRPSAEVIDDDEYEVLYDYPNDLVSELDYIDAQLRSGNTLHALVIASINKSTSFGYPQEQAECTKREFDLPVGERRLTNRSMQLVEVESTADPEDIAATTMGTIPACTHLPPKEPPKEPPGEPPKEQVKPSVDALKKQIEDKIEKEQTSLESFGIRDSKNVYRV